MSATRRKRDMEKDRDKRVNERGCAANPNVPTLFLLGQRPHTWATDEQMYKRQQSVLLEHRSTIIQRFNQFRRLLPIKSESHAIIPFSYTKGSNYSKWWIRFFYGQIPRRSVRWIIFSISFRNKEDGDQWQCNLPIHYQYRFLDYLLFFFKYGSMGRVIFHPGREKRKNHVLDRCFFPQ